MALQKASHGIAQTATYMKQEERTIYWLQDQVEQISEKDFERLNRKINRKVQRLAGTKYLKVHISPKIDIEIMPETSPDSRNGMLARLLRKKR